LEFYGGFVKQSGTDMTSGNIWKIIITFSVPLMCGFFLQSMYNAVDTMIVGNFVSNEALAAVGISMPMIGTIVGFSMGISNGASVWVARSYGARDQQTLEQSIHTAVTLSIIIGLLLGTVGVLVTPHLLHLMLIPEAIFPEALTYFRIYFFGLPALIVYNMGTAILNAMGESKRPMLFLVISAVLNVALDLLFVLEFHLGVGGVAWATVIAEVVTAVLAILSLTFANLPCRLVPQKLRLHLPILKKMVALGAPVGFQQVINGFSTLIMLTYINRLGTIVIAGWSVTAKLDAFIYPMAQAVSLATTTFVGQNLGARQVQRARQGVKISLCLGLLSTGVVSLLLLGFNGVLLRIFSPDPQVIACTLRFMYVLTTTYFVYSLTQILPGALIGSGRVRVPIMINLLSFVACRQIYLYIVSHLHYTAVSIAIAFPLSWVLSGIALLIYYRQSNWNTFGKERS
jgi:putative MATE family efflux protein